MPKIVKYSSPGVQDGNDERVEYIGIIVPGSEVLPGNHSLAVFLRDHGDRQVQEASRISTAINPLKVLLTAQADVDTKNCYYLHIIECRPSIEVQFGITAKEKSNAAVLKRCIETACTTFKTSTEHLAIQAVGVFSQSADNALQSQYGAVNPKQPLLAKPTKTSFCCFQ